MISPSSIGVEFASASDRARVISKEATKKEQFHFDPKDILRILKGKARAAQLRGGVSEGTAELLCLAAQEYMKGYISRLSSASYRRVDFQKQRVDYDISVNTRQILQQKEEAERKDFDERARLRREAADEEWRREFSDKRRKLTAAQKRRKDELEKIRNQGSEKSFFQASNVTALKLMNQTMTDFSALKMKMMASAGKPGNPAGSTSGPSESSSSSSASSATAQPSQSPPSAQPIQQPAAASSSSSSSSSSTFMAPAPVAAAPAAVPAAGPAAGPASSTQSKEQKSSLVTSLDKREITIQDVLHTLESDSRTNRSTLLYDAYVRYQKPRNTR